MLMCDGVWVFRGRVGVPCPPSSKAHDLDAPSTLTALSQLRHTIRANAVIVQFIWQQDDMTASTVYTSEDTTPSADTLERFIRAAHDNHLKYVGQATGGGRGGEAEKERD